MNGSNGTSQWPVVLADDSRPAGPDDQCFYCDQKVGEPHGAECVLVQKLIRIRYEVDVDVMVPYSWAEEEVRDIRNSCEWCSLNALDEIQEKVHFTENSDRCPCDWIRFAKVVRVLDDEPSRG